MAYSTQRTTSDGTLDLIDINIVYFDRSEITVLFDGVVQTSGWSWVGTTEKKIAFSPDVPNGVEVMLVRTTDLSKPRHIFTLGAKFDTQSMDEDIRQILHIAQEAKENATIEEVFHDLNVHGYRVVGLGNGIEPTDAVNKGQLDSKFSDIDISEAAAAASAAAAADSAVAAQEWAEQAEAIVGLSIPVPLELGGTGGVDAGTARNSLGLGSASVKAVGNGVGQLPEVQPDGKLHSSILPAAASSFVTGMIMLWSGSIASIPAGWTLCNGTSGAPNLQDRFVVAAGNTYAVGATGDGSIPSHSHGAGSLSTSNAGSHQHSGVPSGYGEALAVGYSAGVGMTGVAGDHYHSVSGSTGSTGSGTRVIATYYALAYIMKL